MRISTVLMLWLLICVGSSPVSAVVHTSSRVGLAAVLPCSVESLLEPEHTFHIQWETVSNAVFERMGQERFQGEAYRDRADVPEEQLVRGDCSLFLRDVRFSDAGVYESYLVVGQSSIKNRVFIQRVQLAVTDHKDIKSVRTGEELILDLHTHQAEQVIFQKSNDTDWTVLWQKHAVKHKKGHLIKRGNELILSNVTARSVGTYKVLDSEGLALSTIKVTVIEPVLPRETETQQIQSALGKNCSRRVSDVLSAVSMLLLMSLTTLLSITVWTPPLTAVLVFSTLSCTAPRVLSVTSLMVEDTDSLAPFMVPLTASLAPVTASLALATI
ncbi:galectin 17 isoform X4 [Puntigrus tetrazona]|uniref:galectin 17 isoform X4 n=1 Tax=Puntigrus tetrazona TaxID=1606681 RepID=UPI001C897B75|nr:galectin 17 isoform X4 [Puntigrus tetrazona]